MKSPIAKKETFPYGMMTCGERRDSSELLGLRLRHEISLFLKLNIVPLDDSYC